MFKKLFSGLTTKPKTENLEFYNIVADIPNKPVPPISPLTHKPIGPEALAPLFPMSLIMQEVSQEPWIEIPDQVSR